MSSHFVLDKDEKVLFITRRYFFTFFWQLFLAFFLVVMAFFLMFPLFAWGRLGVALFIYCIVVGLIVFCKMYVLWRCNILMITTTRVIKTVQHGFFDQQISEILIPRISDVSYRV